MRALCPFVPLFLIPIVLTAPPPCRSAGPPNLIKNGDFSGGTDAKGWPRSWQCSGDETVDQALSLDRDPDHGFCAKLVCRSITGSGGASHCMLNQNGTVEIQAGKWYRVAFWARQEGIPGGALTIGVSDTQTWENSGIQEGFRVRREWKQFEFQCRAQRSVPAQRFRLQIWHHSRGTFWIVGMEITAADAPRLRYSPLLETDGRKNLVPNSSFECGTAGWRSITRLRGWAGNLDRLLGELAAGDAPHGGHSLKVSVDPLTTPTYFFDYFEPQQDPVRMPLAANVGWIPVEKGATYTLSAYLKADQPGVPAVLAVYFGDDPAAKNITITDQWQRYSFSLPARGDACFVALGPDLRNSGLPRASAWIDGVQFEKGAEATPYAPADSLEVGVELQKDSPILPAGQPVSLAAIAYNDTGAAASARITTQISDFDDHSTPGPQLTLDVGPHISASAILPTGLAKLGFYRVRVHTEAGDRIRDTRLRLAVIQPYHGKDSFWGMNHAYPWDELIKEVREAGILWMRDWSLKWQTVQPQKGPFTFRQIDPLIDRPIALGEKMDLLLPFPSSNWASRVPEPARPAAGYPGERERMADMPRSLEEFGDYVSACVSHYRDRTHTWEVLNEPLYTDYALPQGRGYTPGDYVSLLKIAYAAAKKADPACLVIGGIAGSGGELYDKIIAEGCLDSLDVMDIHTYPGIAPPENCEGWLAALNQRMQDAGKPKPIWLTEVGYYAEDEPSISPEKFEMPVVESEKLCAAYCVRLNTLMLANHVARVFYHAGSSPRLNHESMETVFFDYGGAPRKVFTAQSAMANLFPPQTTFAERLKCPAGLRAYLFRNPTGPLLVAWAEEDARGELSWSDHRLQGLDIQGNNLPGSKIDLTEYPVYVQGRGVTDEEFEGAVEVRGAPN